MSNRFLAQVPARAAEEVLFQTRPTFLANLEAIADHIARPALLNRRSAPMTFGLYGAWGMGKSTALNALDEMLTERLGSQVRYSSSQYEASLWQGAGDARTSLSYSILNGLSAEMPGLLAASLAGLRDDTSRTGNGGSSPLAEAVAFRAALAQLSDAPPLLEQWMRELTAGVTDNGQRPGVHVVFIDDLDRCSAKFTTEVLAATTYWMATRQTDIFFVLAVSQEHLVRSLEEFLPLGEQYPDQALEKYVHVAVQVPSLLDNTREVHAFLLNLLSLIDVEGDSDGTLRLAELTAIVQGSLTSYPHCVIAPLLRVEGKISPRTAKSRLNTFLAEFRPSKQVTEEDVKIWILKALWPGFWWERYWRFVLGEDAEELEWLQRFERVGESMQALWEVESNDLRPIFARLSRDQSLETGDLDPHLAIYLSLQPVLTLTPQERSKAVDLEGVYTSTDSELPGDISEFQGDRRSQLLLLRIRLKRHADEGQRSEALADLNEILSLVRRENFADDPGAVGNIAITAESVDSAAALELHRAAHNLNPSHVNISLNFLAYILETRSDRDYALAQSILDRHENSDDPRVGVLRLRLAIARGESVPITERRKALLPYLSRLDTEPTSQRVLALSSQASNLGLVAPIEFRDEYKVAGGRATRAIDLAAIVESFANGLPSSDVKLAVDAYRFLLDTGLACVDSQARTGRFQRVTSNLAIALQNGGFTAAAARVFFSLYRSDTSQQSVARSLASALFSLNLGSLAEAVISRQPLDDALVLDDEYELPEAPAPDEDPWWRASDLRGDAPCSNVLPRTSVP